MVNGGILPVSVQGNNHDRSQIEINIDYRPGLSGVFHTDIYFFLPRNLGVNSNSYSQDQFYNDLINHLRFHTPLHFDLLKDEIKILNDILKASATAQEREQYSALAIQQIKLFANRANTFLKRLYERFSTINKPTQEDEASRESIALIQELYSYISEFRIKFVKFACVSSLRMPSEVRQALLNSDEFISNRLLAICSDLLQRAAKLEENNTENSENKSKRRLMEVLGKVLVQEKKYRKSMSDFYVDVGSNERDREYFYFRHSLLKKEIAQPLYINKNNFKQEKTYRNWVAGSGAALAGLWAQIANYQTNQFQGHKDFGLSIFGLSVIFILIYVFKDRIKDVTKEYINDKMKALLPDYRSELEFSEVDKSGKKVTNLIGKLSEYMRFVSSNGVPEDIQYIRRLKGRRDIGAENLETVIQYHKTLHLDSEARILGCDQGLCNIKDIHRFNFSYFLNHLDDAKKQMSVFDEDEGAVKISAPKVYHINVVSLVKAGSVTIYNHFRIVLDKEGIVRMETVLPSYQVQEGARL